MKIKQGDIFLANLSPVKGHEQSGLRPVVVLQKTLLNQKLNTVMIVPLTSNMKARNFLLTHFLPTSVTNLTHDSVALVFQIRTIDKSRLTKHICCLSDDQIVILKEKLGYAI
jgi:mRNA interferase MazF